MGGSIKTSWVPCQVIRVYRWEGRKNAVFWVRVRCSSAAHYSSITASLAFGGQGPQGGTTVLLTKGEKEDEICSRFVPSTNHWYVIGCTRKMLPDSASASLPSTLCFWKVCCYRRPVAIAMGDGIRRTSGQSVPESDVWGCGRSCQAEGRRILQQWKPYEPETQGGLKDKTFASFAVCPCAGVAGVWTRTFPWHLRQTSRSIASFVSLPTTCMPFCLSCDEAGSHSLMPKGGIRFGRRRGCGRSLGSNATSKRQEMGEAFAGKSHTVPCPRN